jgi:hypothetical protein
VPGSEAQKVAPAHSPRRSRTTLPKKAPSEKIRVLVDPVALGSVVVAVAMLVLMVVGMVQYSHACEKHAVMESYVTQLRDENARLEHNYHISYDLADVEAKALAMGLVPMEEIPTMSVRVIVPTPEAEETAWDELVWFVKGLFA